MFGDVYRGKKVLVTGHTGFKGSWLSEWLLMLGAKVIGFALDPPTEPSLFHELGLASRLDDRRGDVARAEDVADLVKRERPAVIFHLAAQPLVRESYDRPVETFSTNVMGTVSVLDAVRCSGHPCSVVVVTTDKCYHNREWVHGYREDDRLGGHDPYSASKACAELVVASYQKSFGASHDVRVCSARAGNVIGGGDWAAHRIVPDSMKALARGESIAIRNPAQTRPWQHVLEPLSGYLWLGALLVRPELLGADDSSFRTAFNFGPQPESNRTVRDLVEEVLKHWPGSWHHEKQNGAPHEAGLLSLAIDKACHALRWRPAWDFPRAVAETTSWYRQLHEGAGAAELLAAQITQYSDDARGQRIAWAEAEA